MTRAKTKKDPIHLINSDEKILHVLEQSNEYLEINKALPSKIDEIVWIHRSLTDLIPQTMENLTSGHLFPLLEAEYELESSIELCKLGFYKHAIIALRNVLELGLLSIYYDMEGRSHIDIQKWLLSSEATPFRKAIFAKLKTNENIRKFDAKHKIFDETARLYGQLSDFAHTKGVLHSIVKLGESNYNRFNEKSLQNWMESMTDVIKIVAIFHILKYPVGLQNTQLDQKFGLNGPAGGFLEPHQTEKIKRFLGKDVADDLQEISDNDPEAKSMAEWINEQPDITEEEYHMQIEEHDKQMITALGFKQWLKIQKEMHRDLDKVSSDKHQEILRYWAKLRKWCGEQHNK